ncbi:MAG: hypothetical protein WBI40_13145 [Methylococcaceae bacterium]
MSELSALSLDDLAHEFESIQRQGQLMQGRILLEARQRFKADADFGKWIVDTGGAIGSISRQHRTLLMNLARFFENRSLEKICISAAYEIAAPKNADIAVEVYEYVKDKNLPLNEIRKQIEIRKQSTDTKQPVEKVTENVRIIPTEKPVITGKPVKTREDIILEDVLEGLTDGEKRHVLNNCLKRLSLYPK